MHPGLVARREVIEVDALLSRERPRDYDRIMAVDPKKWVDHAAGKITLTIGQVLSNPAESMISSIGTKVHTR